MIAPLDRFAARLVEDDLPIDRDALGLRVADTLGAFVEGTATREGRLLADLDASDDRALAAAGAIRLTELDDIDLATCTTASAVVVPAAIAAARARALAPERFARALAAGYAATTRRARAAGGIAALARGVWPTLLAAPLGAAATYAVALDLPAERVAAALRLALRCERETAGATVGPFPHRWWLFGTSVAAGIAAARAAAAGMTVDTGSDERIAADGDAFGAAIGPDDLGRVARKTVPCARQGANALVAFAELVRAHALRVDAIASVEVAVPPACVRVIAQPLDVENRLTTIANAGFALATALLDPALARRVERQPPFDPALLAFAERVHVVADDALAASFPTRWPARVTIRRTDGGTHERVQQTIPGDPDAPFTLADLARKYPSLAAALADAAHATRDAGALARTVERFR